MKAVRFLFLYFVFQQSSLIVFGQASVANNTAGGANYLGWTTTVTTPLKIRHDATFVSGTTDPSIQFWVSGLMYAWIDGNTKNFAIGSSINVNPPYKLTVENDIDI